MTIIVATKEVMVSDSQITSGYLISSCKKLFRIGNHIIGCAGNQDDGLLFVEWYKLNLSERDDKKPKLDNNFIAVVLTSFGCIYIYTDKLIEIPVEEDFTAIGVGSEVALGAMYQGATPVQAVTIACKLMDGCGGKLQIATCPYKQ